MDREHRPRPGPRQRQRRRARRRLYLPYPFRAPWFYLIAAYLANAIVIAACILDPFYPDLASSSFAKTVKGMGALCSHAFFCLWGFSDSQVCRFIPDSVTFTYFCFVTACMVAEWPNVQVLLLWMLAADWLGIMSGWAWWCWEWLKRPIGRRVRRRLVAIGFVMEREDRKKRAAMFAHG